MSMLNEKLEFFPMISDQIVSEYEQISFTMGIYWFVYFV